MKHLEEFQAATGFMRYIATVADAYQNLATWLGADAYAMAPMRGSRGIHGQKPAQQQQNPDGPPKARQFGPRGPVVQGFAEESDGLISPAIVMGGGAGSGLSDREG